MVSHHVAMRDEDDGWFTCCTPGLRKPKGFGDFPRAEDEVKLEFEQPAREAFPSARPQSRRPQTSNSTRVSTWIENSYSRVRDRTTSFGSAAVRPWTSQSRRPRISAPTDFRRVTEPLPVRRRSFRPLELSIYMPSGRLSPLPDFESSDWERKLESLRMPAPAVLRGYDDLEDGEVSRGFQIQRKPLSMPNPTTHRLSHAAEISFENGPGPTLRGGDEAARWSDGPSHAERTPTMPTARLEDMIPSSRPLSRSHLGTSGLSSPLRLRSPSPFSTSSRSRSQTDPLRPLRTSSLRRSKPDTTVDEAIRELNTIVEERRLSALNKGLHIRSNVAGAGSSIPPSPTTHVPAIAPSMKVRARSETLSDIGSAFSVPLSGKAVFPTPPLPNRQHPKSPEPLPLSTTSSTTALPPVTIPIPPAAAMPLQPTPTLKPSTRSRLTTWLRRSVASPDPDSQPDTPTQSQPFYRLRDAKISASHAYTSSRASVSTVSTVSTVTTLSTIYNEGTYTPTTTVATSILSPTSPSDSVPEMPDGPAGRPSMSKSGPPRNSRSLKRVKPKRGLSIETTASNSSPTGKAPPPPPYQQLDPNPVSPISPTSPGRVGVAF